MSRLPANPQPRESHDPALQLAQQLERLLARQAQTDRRVLMAKALARTLVDEIALLDTRAA